MYPADTPQFGAATAGIFLQFLPGSFRRFFQNKLCRRGSSTDTYGKIRGTNAALPPGGKTLLDHTVFQRMKGNDRQPPPVLQTCKSGVQCSGQAIQFAIDGDAQCLKDTAGRMSIPSGGSRHCIFYQFSQLAGGFNGGIRPLPQNSTGNGAGKFLLPISVKNIGQLFFVQMIDHVGSCLSLLAHTHIQRGVMVIGKPPLRLVQLVGGYPDIQKDTVHRFYTQPDKT